MSSSFISLKSNVASLQAQRQLASSTDNLSSSYARLSSGLRINTASDDAAGLAVSSKLKADARIFTQAIRNINDGASTLAIASGAVESLSNIVTRLQELAEQSSNGSYSVKQRASMDAEAQALSKEYFRISKSTRFNGINLLDGTVQGLSLQAGYGTGGSILSSLGGTMGTGSFKPRSTVESGAFAGSIDLRDLNGDGVLDMVSTDVNTNSVLVSLGNGDGTFKNKMSFATGSQSSVVLGDINNDGNVDILGSDGTNIQYLLGNGDGSFKANQSFAAGNTMTSLTVSDVNGDGILDLLGISDSDQTLSVMLGNGNGSFKARGSFQLGSSPSAIDIGDLNGDGILDVVVTDSIDHNVSLLLGNGDGSFRARFSMTTGFTPRSVAIGDLNGDGMLDIVTSDYDDYTTSVFLGNGNGTFKTKISFSIGSSPVSLKLGDFNSDGVLDIVTVDQGDSTTSVLLGNGNGTFQGRNTFQIGSIATAVALGDLNGDGVLDIVTSDSDDSTASILLANTKDGVSPILPFSLKSIADARQAISIFSNTANNLALQKGKLGAFESRLKTALNVTQSSVLEYQGAHSRIVDVDVAEETSRLISTQILQRSATSILSQANQIPAIVLQLL